VRRSPTAASFASISATTRAASGRHAEQLGEREDDLLDLGERVGVEGDDLGVGCAELVDAVGGDGADRAEVLGQD
jgi:hypothetical protein